MKIRLVEDADYKETAKLHKETIRKINFKDHSKELISIWSTYNTEDSLRRNSDKNEQLVAVEGKKVVGFSDYSLKDCEIRGLYSHKDYVGQGVGSKLLKASEKSLRQAGCKEVVLESTITARQFYENRGYKIIGEVFHILGKENLPAFTMVKGVNK